METRQDIEGEVMTVSEPHSVVVGVDRSPGSQLALRWATEEASMRSLPVHVVAVYQRQVTSLTPTVAVETEPPEAEQKVFEEAVAFVSDRLGPDRVSGTLVSGRPAAVLVEESAGAELLVVGSRARTTLASVALGSVGSAVAAHAKSPVVVVRGAPSSIHRIVVGVDGSARSERALEFAFEEAARRGWGLDAIYVWQPVEAADPAVWTLEKAGAELENRRRELRERVAPFQEKQPDVSVTTHVIEGRPATVLAAQSKAASLIVVGTRGHGGIAGLLLGSVSQGLLHHSHCTAAVVRGGDAEPGE